jgi:UDP-N-acetyl-D-glucosamine dehydrogenase
MSIAQSALQSEVSPAARLRDRILRKQAAVGIIGLGYVGLPLSLLFAEGEFTTTGFDIDTRKVESLERGESYIKHIGSETIRKVYAERQFRATSDFSELSEMDVIIICVPTPLDEYRQPDLSYVRSTAEAVRAELRRGQIVVLESTTYPGTTEEEVLPILEKSGLHCPVIPYLAEDVVPEAMDSPSPDFFLAFSPEREDPANSNYSTAQIPKVIGAVNAPSALAAQLLYQSVFDRTVVVSSSRAAEMSKLLENIYRCVNIALVNELKLLCQHMNIDIWEVIKAASTKPFGFQPFYPGPGLGGHCIPIDPFYLSWKAREYDFPTRFIELAGEINSAMPAHVVEGVAESLDRRHKTLAGAQVLVLGVAYKKDVDDTRESPALRIMELLQRRGASVAYHDPYVARLCKMRKYEFGLESVPLTAETLRRYDCVLVATDHTAYDYDFIVRESSLVIDTRNATARVTQGREKIVRL